MEMTTCKCDDLKGFMLRETLLDIFPTEATMKPEFGKHPSALLHSVPQSPHLLYMLQRVVVRFK